MPNGHPKKFSVGSETLFCSYVRGIDSISSNKRLEPLKTLRDRHGQIVHGKLSNHYACFI